MTILEDLFDLCDSCNVETEKARLVEGWCDWCRQAEFDRDEDEVTTWQS